ncbi:MAG: hypothetical protein ACRCSV_00035 [Chlamydiales bacterium]
MYLYNDSPYVLNASILSADGAQLDSVLMQPRQRRTWYRQAVINSNTSMTPFTVVWTCRNGADFGVSYQVNAGGVATPLSSTGPRYCKPEKKNSSDDRSRRYDEEYQHIIPLDPQIQDVNPHP